MSEMPALYEEWMWEIEACEGGGRVRDEMSEQEELG